LLSSRPLVCVIAMNLTWQNNPLRELLRLSWPIAASCLSFSAMTLVDTLLMGHLGRAEQAGVGFAGTAGFVLVCFPIGLLQGGKALISQAVGASRPVEARLFRGASLWSALAMGGVTLVIGQIAASLVPHLTATAAAGEAARTYLGIRTLGAPILLVYVALRESSYAHGNARRPMLATVIANGCNIGLAVLFVFGFRWGVAGAAWATLIAHAVELGVMVVSSRDQGWALRSVRKEQMVSLWKIGLPTGAQFMLEIGAFGILSVMISVMSEVDMAGHQIALQIIHFSFLPAMAVGEAASVLAGQSVGAGHDRLVTRVSRLALGVGVAYTAGCSLVFLLGAGWIASTFSRDTQVIALAVQLLRIGAAFQMFDAANIVGRSVLRGIGDVRYAAVVGVSCAWLCTPPLTWLLGHRLGLGARGGWLALSVEILISVALFWWRLEKAGWRPAARRAREQLDESREAGLPADVSA
jgi:MATE family multidrug resistance protein